LAQRLKAPLRAASYCAYEATEDAYNGDRRRTFAILAFGFLGLPTGSKCGAVCAQ
jgi:hypothetical protein